MERSKRCLSQMERAERNKIIRAMFALGFTKTQIAHCYEMNVNWICKIVNRHRPKYGGIQARHKKVIDLTASGMNAGEIAKMTGYSVHTVYNIRKLWRQRHEQGISDRQPDARS